MATPAESGSREKLAEIREEWYWMYNERSIMAKLKQIPLFISRLLLAAIGLHIFIQVLLHDTLPASFQKLCRSVVRQFSRHKFEWQGSQIRSLDPSFLSVLMCPSGELNGLIRVLCHMTMAG